MIPFDGSGYSQKAFDKALEIAEKFASKLLVLTVLQSKLSDSAGVSLERMQEIQDEEKDTATIMLKKTRISSKCQKRIISHGNYS